MASTSRWVSRQTAAAGEFDLSDKTDARSGIWTLPRLKRAPAPAWAIEVKRPLCKARVSGQALRSKFAVGGSLARRSPPAHRWRPARTLPPARCPANRRYGLLHQRGEQLESLDWIDFATGRRLTIANGPHGGIDHATIDATPVRSFAWTERSADKAITGSPSARPASTSKGRLSSAQPIHWMGSGTNPASAVEPAMGAGHRPCICSGTVYPSYTHETAAGDAFHGGFRLITDTDSNHLSGEQ